MDAEGLEAGGDLRVGEGAGEMRLLEVGVEDVDGAGGEVGSEEEGAGVGLVDFGGVAYGRTSLDFDDGVSSLSPDYSLQDLDALGPAAMFSASHLLRPLLKFDQESVTHFDCPIFVFEGRHDFATSHIAAADWFDHVHAPEKKLVWFENSAHMVMEEEPGRFLLHLVNDVRPIALRAGDAPAEDLPKAR